MKLAACLAPILAAGPASAATVIVDDSFQERALGLHVDLAHDPTNRVSAEDVALGKLPFAPSTKEVPSFGYRGGAEWAQFTIDDRRPPGAEALRLVNGNAQTDRFECFEVLDSAVVSRAEAGDQVPLARWSVAYREPTCLVHPGSRRVLVRTTGDSSHQLPLALLTRERFEGRLRRDLLVQSLFFGALLVMAAYNGLVAVATRSRAYSYYVAYLLSYGMVVLATGGLLAFLEPSRIALINFAAPWAIALVGASSLYFAAALFGLDRQSRWGRALRGLANLVLLAQVVAGLISYPWAARAALVFVPPGAAVLIGSGIHAWRNGSRLGPLFLAAWGTFILGGFANVGRVLGILPANAFTSNAQQVGSVIEFLLLSFALAHRIKELQLEATRNAELAAKSAREAADNAELAHAATAKTLEVQARTNAELRRLDTLKDEFLANTSHELRTPLHGILGLTEGVLGAGRGLDRASRERLELVVASGRRLTLLVNDLLDFSKLRHHGLALREKAVELRGAVAMTLSVLAPSAEPKGLALRSEVPGGLYVRADEGRLQQIFMNLVGNAVKFTDAGHVIVRAVRGEDGRVRVSVHDTGIGISKAAQTRVFESFEQADGSNARGYGGTGLGLAVARHLVELHGGRIGVESEEGVGSTFFFDIAATDGLESAAEADDGATIAQVGMNPAAAHGEAATGGGHLVGGPLDERGLDDDGLAASVGYLPFRDERAQTRAGSKAASRLLIADDDAVNVEVLRAQLEPDGHAVVVARDGAQAVSLLESSGPFDAVLLDVMMPRLTGPQAASEIRAQYPHGTLPILMLTAKSRPEDAVAGLRAGADDYVGKPFHRDELLARLDVHLASSRMTRAFRRFVPGDVLELLGVTRFEALEAGLGQKRCLTVLFTDIRDFTKRSERLGPEGTFRFVNGCLERFEPVVRAHGGFVDKFIGDAVMAIFPGNPLDAVRAAEGLSAEVRAFNAARAGEPMPLSVGIGVHKGPVIVGTVGGAARMDVTVIGDAVNVAARLEGLTKAMGTAGLVSEDALDGARDGTRRVGAVRVKGRDAPVELFEILACCETEAERAQKVSTHDGFQRALRAFAQADLGRARGHLEAVVDKAPLDRVAALYLERCVHFSKAGLPDDFDGSLGGNG